MYPSSCGLEHALARVDAVVVAVPMNDETRGLIGPSAVAAMQPHADTFVNVARGAIVDTAALKAALKDDRIAGAALDVVDPEPLPPTDSLWLDPRVLITPHIAGFGSIESSHRIVNPLRTQRRASAKGEPLEAQIAL